MLQDILNEFMNHVKQYPEFDCDSLVLENYVLKPGLYVRLNNDGSMDDMYVTKKTLLPDNNNLLIWFKKADFDSSLVEMNKPVDPKKQIHSNNIFSIFCKHQVFAMEGKVHPNLKDSIHRYFNAFLAPRDKESNNILNAAGYTPLREDKVRANEQYFIKSLDAVVERIKSLGIKENCYIKLFLNEGENEYAYESGRYLLPKIFNNNSCNVNMAGRVFGLSNSDMGMNSKKPYLEHKTTPFKVPFRITTEEAVLLRKLYLWLNGQNRDGKSLYEGYIPTLDHTPSLLEVMDEVGTHKPVMFLHFDRGIGISIDDYDFLPRYSDLMSRPIKFTNYLNAQKYQGGILNKLSAVEAHINENLYAYQLVRNYYVDRVKASEKVSQSLANQIMIAREPMKAWFRKCDTMPIESGIDKITMGAIFARLENLEYIPALAHALNVRFSLMRYFSKEETDMGATIEAAYQELKEKVLMGKGNGICQNDMEFYLAVGQLMRYFFSLSEAQSPNYDLLWRGVAGAKSVEDIKKEYRKHFQKYAYDIRINNPRFNKMLSIVASYEPDKDSHINLDALFFGFASDNIIYFKEKEEA